MGPSGSGKSTIIKLITAEVAATRGRLMVNGYNLRDISEKQVPLLRRTLGVVFQDFRLIDKKTVYENLDLAMRAVGATPREIQRRIPYVLDLVGLDQQGGPPAHPALRRGAAAGGHRPGPGQQSPASSSPTSPPATWIPARSLEIMIPAGAASTSMGTTLLVVTHERELVNRFAKRVVAIESGRIISDAAGGYYGNGRETDLVSSQGGCHGASSPTGFMSFAAVCMTVACLLIMGSFTLVAVNAGNILQDLEDENQFTAYVDDSLRQNEARALQERHRRRCPMWPPADLRHQGGGPGRTSGDHAGQLRPL